MNTSLFSGMLRNHSKSLASYVSAMVAFLVMVVWVYPSIANSSVMDELLKSLPETLVRAVGLQGGIQQFGNYLSAQFYDLLFTLTLAVYCTMTASELMARLVERGSMAYLLSTPVSRVKVAVTQALVLLAGVFTIVVSVVISGLIAVPLLAPQASFDKAQFIQVNVVGFFLFCVVSAYSFLVSCVLNDERAVLGAAGTVTTVFYMMDLVGKLSEKFEWVRHLSPFSLFRPHEMGDTHVVATCLGLGAAAAVLFAVAVIVFKRRDLML